MPPLFIPLTAAEAALRYSQALVWAGQHTYAAVLGHHHQPYPHGTFPSLIAAGAQAVYANHKGPFAPPLGQLWLGAISYDYGCQQLGAKGASDAGFSFFCPQHVLQWLPTGVEIASPTPEQIWQAIIHLELDEKNLAPASLVAPAGISMGAYEQAINQILAHLHAGQAYEVNFCHKEAVPLPADTPWPALYARLVQHSPMPFQFAFASPSVRMVGASPERFLRRMGSQIICQPIKGTAPRGHTDAEDLALRQRLQTEEKVLAENMMITDLVRNDLVQICTPGSVDVQELFGLYTFARVHQLITTVQGQLAGSCTFEALLRATFPMGSMTGAPKKRALEIIAETEAAPRGYFSGVFGYILPNGDFDLAVVIRTLFLEHSQAHYSAGGAIVWDSTAQDEYAESILKMGGMRYAVGLAG